MLNLKVTNMNYSQSYERFVNGASSTLNVFPQMLRETPQSSGIAAGFTAPELFDLLGAEFVNEDENPLRGTYTIIEAENNIYTAKQSASSIYILAAGTVKTLCAHGDSQVVRIFLPGDILGLEDLDSPVHNSTAIAVSDNLLIKIPRCDVLRLCNTWPEFQLAVLNIFQRQKFWCNVFPKVLANENRQIKFALFLYGIAIRTGTFNHPATAFDLPLKRKDIAVHLEITSDSLDWIFREFHQLGIIRMEANSIRIEKMSCLQEMWNSISERFDDSK
jgi:CRP/FNR family transcriptional regulator